jgi:translation initiation factor IF-2
MWHQFGVIPDSPDQGIFIDIDEIPVPWLKYHYDVVSVNSPYNDNDVANNGAKVFREMKSLADLAGFNRKSSTTRLGEIAQGRTIKEAIVAVPYIIESVTDTAQINNEQRNFGATRKKFIEIPKKRFHAALRGSADSDLDTAGESIRKLVNQMQHYVLPPQFDYVTNTRIKPIVMYMFEFEFEFDQDDLSYMWQNLAPRDYKKMELKYESTAHALMNTELLTEDNLLDNPNLRWMVFKVKQKSQTNYYDLITPQVGEASTDIFDFTETKTGYDLSFNWPYDYFSFVELVKIDTEVLFNSNEKDLSQSSPNNNQQGGSNKNGSNNNKQGGSNKNGSNNNKQGGSNKNGSNNSQQRGSTNKKQGAPRYTQGPSKT